MKKFIVPKVGRPVTTPSRTSVAGGTSPSSRTLSRNQRTLRSLPPVFSSMPSIIFAIHVFIQIIQDGLQLVF